MRGLCWSNELAGDKACASRTLSSGVGASNTQWNRPCYAREFLRQRVTVFFSTQGFNFIEHYWCRAKWFASGYDSVAMKAMVPEALNNASICSFCRLLQEFKQTVDISRRKVEKKTNTLLAHTG